MKSALTSGYCDFKLYQTTLIASISPFHANPQYFFLGMNDLNRVVIHDELLQ